MTYRIPEKTLADKLLALIGKQRALSIPENAYRRLGPYVIMQAQKESFWRAFFRPKNENPPKGWFYPLK